MTVDAAQRATDLVTAAAARAAAYGGIGGEKLNRTAPPQEVGSARLVPFVVRAIVIPRWFSRNATSGPAARVFANASRSTITT